MKIQKVEKKNRYFIPQLSDAFLSLAVLFIFDILSSLAGYTSNTLGGQLIFIAGAWLLMIIQSSYVFKRPVLRLPYEIID